MAVIDLNADVGEGSPADAELLEVVTSANVAGGGHAGGGDLLDETVRAAAACGVAVGAHPSYPDRAGFGRHSLLGTIEPATLWESVAAQVVDVGRACLRHDVALRHVKAHGALYHDLARDPEAAQGFLVAVAEAEQRLGPGGRLAVVGPPGGALLEAAVAVRRRYLREGFADRGYLPDGSLVPRTESGALLDPAGATAQALGLACDHLVATAAGTRRLEVDTLCVHSDTPGAAELARSVRAALEHAGVTVRPPRP